MQVDATKESELAGRFGVNGYPTLKLFRNGKASDYKGGREEDTIVKYMRKQVGPAAKPVETAADVEAYVAKKKDTEDAHFLGLFHKDKKTSLLQSAFVIVANQMRDDYVFLRSSAPELLTKYNVGDEVRW